MRLISLSGLFDGPSIPERVTRRKTKPTRSFGRWNSPQDDRAKAGPAALPPGTRSGGGCPQDDRAKAGSDPPPPGARSGDGTALRMTTLGRPDRSHPVRDDNNSRPGENPGRGWYSLCCSCIRRRSRRFRRCPVPPPAGAPRPRRPRPWPRCRWGCRGSWSRTRR